MNQGVILKLNKKALELIQDFIKRKNAPNSQLGTLHTISICGFII